MNEQNELELMTPKHAGKYLGISTPIIRRLVKQRKIASYKVSRSVRIAKVDLDEYLMSCRKPQIIKT